MHAAQATLPLEFNRPAPRAVHEWSDAGGTGFEIGWDHAQHRLTPPVDHLQPGSPVRQGWEAGKATFGPRTRAATPHVRKWLQLRLNAWQRGRAFCTLQVTPALLRRIDVAVCPITREPLTRGTGGPLDASVDRVNNDAGYAAGNLAVMSVRANAAKAAYAWDDAMGFVRQIEAGALGTVDGLSAAQWARLAVLMSYATPLPHAVAATLPMLVLPPPRLRLLNAVQCLQALLTLQFTRDGYTQRIAALAELMPCATTRDALRGLMHTLLARRIAAGFAADGAALRRVLEDVWADALVLRRWQRLALALSEAQCEQIVRTAQRRGLAGAQLRWLPRALATEGWALQSRGYVTPGVQEVEALAAAA
ncbi:MAG: hypothetical protein HS128_08080 [Ideonella sp.]|nr:hypothetical protein [Ideonella sp.]MCC7456754.1 hypothetical protein [Nitrospira sp.]